MAKAKSKDYINKKELLSEIYKSREQDQLTRKAVGMLMTLAQRTIRKLYYKCEDDKQHALSEAYFDISKNWRKFDPDYAKYHGYEKLKAGDEIRVHPEKGSDRTAAAIVVENYPIETLIDKELDHLTSLGKRDVSYVISNDECEVKFFYLKKGIKISNTQRDEDYDNTIIDVTGSNRIKLEYIVKKNKRDIAIFDKKQIIIRDPNPFSFYTSYCINGYAKGWKRLNPPKSKGLLLSIDSGFDTEGDGMHSYN